VRYNPNDIWFWHNLGNAFMGAGQYDRAVTTFEKALSFDPSNESLQSRLREALDKRDGS